jgi:hypothetical protein
MAFPYSKDTGESALMGVRKGRRVVVMKGDGRVMRGMGAARAEKPGNNRENFTSMPRTGRGVSRESAREEEDEEVRPFPCSPPSYRTVYVPSIFLSIIYLFFPG